MQQPLDHEICKLRYRHKSAAGRKLLLICLCRHEPILYEDDKVAQYDDPPDEVGRIHTTQVIEPRSGQTLGLFVREHVTVVNCPTNHL
jgi:hypothetical protein